MSSLIDGLAQVVASQSFPMRNVVDMVAGPGMYDRLRQEAGVSLQVLGRMGWGGVARGGGSRWWRRLVDVGWGGRGVLDWRAAWHRGQAHLHCADA